MVSWLLQKLESISAKWAFTGAGFSGAALILYVIGSVQGVTDTSLVLLLRIVGWSSGVTILLVVYNILAIVLIRMRGDFLKYRLLHLLVRDILQLSFSAGFFVFQGYILLITNS